SGRAVNYTPIVITEIPEENKKEEKPKENEEIEHVPQMQATRNDQGKDKNAYSAPFLEQLQETQTAKETTLVQELKKMNIK
ncbi:hypothetical protein KI387_041773, partial [Taxus chinensis]